MNVTQLSYYFKLSASGLAIPQILPKPRVVDPSLSENRYQKRGVSSSKDEVHRVVDRMDPGLVPGAFCKVLPDILTADPKRATIIHSDGAGTKSILAYLHYRETGDPSVFRGIAQDSIVMNLDDLLCAGATGPVLLSSTVNRNARNFPGEALAALIEGTEDFLARLRELGIPIFSGGGETADVGDLTGTVTVDSCAVVSLERKQIVDNDRIEPGLTIVGVSSSGQAAYENAPNSGIGSNGLTSARHDMLSPYYRKRYPESCDPNTPEHLSYCGPYRLEDPLPETAFTVGEALLSPTRTYAPLVKELLDRLGRRIRGLVHCSGGGQTKCRRFGRTVHYVKDQLFPLPPLFRDIQRVSGTPWREMFQVFNMGHRLEIYVKPSQAARVMEVARSFDLEAREIGHTEIAAGKNQVSIHFQNETYTYS